MKKAIAISAILLISALFLSGCIKKTDTQPNGEELIELAEDKTCTETDAGKDYYVKGDVETCDFVTEEEPGAGGPVGCALVTDLCEDANFLFERYCEGNELKVERYECPHGCRDGACVREPLML